MKLGALLVTMALVGADGGSQVGSDDIALKVGETTVKARVHQAPGEALRLVNVHDDEDTSVEAGLALIGEFGGRVVELVHRGTRLVQFHLGKQTYLIDPNRMFTDEGARRDLALHGPTSPEALKVVRAFAERYLEVVEPRPGEVLVALHNNSPDPSFSVLAYAKGGIYAHEAAKVHVARDKHPDDFFFVTEPALFEALKGRGYNTVLQDNAHATDDGSLSVRCAKDGIRYVNVEAQHGHLDAQRDMLRALRDVIGPVPHDARLGSTPTH